MVSRLAAAGLLAAAGEASICTLGRCVCACAWLCARLRLDCVCERERGAGVLARMQGEGAGLLLPTSCSLSQRPRETRSAARDPRHNHTRHTHPCARAPLCPPTGERELPSERKTSPRDARASNDLSSAPAGPRAEHGRPGPARPRDVSVRWRPPRHENGRRARVACRDCAAAGDGGTTPASSPPSPSR